jgi:hypothetical protein
VVWIVTLIIQHRNEQSSKLFDIPGQEVQESKIDVQR